MLRVEMGWGVGWGGVGHVNVRLHLLHEVDATCFGGQCRHIWQSLEASGIVLL